jgi:hypothetical protein
VTVLFGLFVLAGSIPKPESAQREELRNLLHGPMRDLAPLTLPLRSVVKMLVYTRRTPMYAESRSLGQGFNIVAKPSAVGNWIEIAGLVHACR